MQFSTVALEPSVVENKPIAITSIQKFKPNQVKSNKEERRSKVDFCVKYFLDFVLCSIEKTPELLPQYKLRKFKIWANTISFCEFWKF